MEQKEADTEQNRTGQYYTIQLNARQRNATQCGANSESLIQIKTRKRSDKVNFLYIS